MIAYIVDVYNKKISPEYNIIHFLAFSFFFPQFIAGPIERAKHLLPQFKSIYIPTNEEIENSITLLIYAYFVKICIADHAGLIVDNIFSTTIFSAYSVIFGTLMFSLQIYTDFMAYSLMAYAFALLLGIRLSLNFNLPYWSCSLKEFWSRWHITLSQWIRDYLYIPLGGNRGTQARVACNLLIAMALGGLWHGASWNFIIWGLWHGIALIVFKVFTSKNQPISKSVLYTATSWICTMLVITVGWFFFRVTNMSTFLNTIRAMSHWELLPANVQQIIALIFLCLPLILVEYAQKKSKSYLPVIHMAPLIKLFSLLCMLICTCALFSKNQLSFIYFQF
jgi:D-alanyl-lipoteichoic acid acyltransferase DltB (MBOAT superfamily)